jgi:hypothetical protein
MTSTPFQHNDDTGTSVSFITGWLRLLPEQFRYYSVTIYYAIHMIPVNLAAPPFVYRYLIICWNNQISKPKLLLIYAAFLSPPFGFCLINSYFRAKYAPLTMERLPANVSEYCPEMPYITNYEKTDIVGTVSV